MYAIVEIAGQQFKVRKDQQVFVHRLDAKEGDKINFDRVLLIDDNGKVNVGAPAINGAQVSAKVVKHLKGDKVIVFKKKRRKGYKVKNGHRQALTEIQIDKIVASGGKKATDAKAEVKKTETKSKAASTSSPKKSTAKKTSAKKETSEEKTTTKKTTDKKSTAKKAAPKKKTETKKTADKKDDKKES